MSSAEREDGLPKRETKFKKTEGADAELGRTASDGEQQMLQELRKEDESWQTCSDTQQGNSIRLGEPKLCKGKIGHIQPEAIKDLESV